MNKVVKTKSVGTKEMRVEFVKQNAGTFIIRFRNEIQYKDVVVPFDCAVETFDSWGGPTITSEQDLVGRAYKVALTPAYEVESVNYVVSAVSPYEHKIMPFDFPSNLFSDCWPVQKDLLKEAELAGDKDMIHHLEHNCSCMQTWTKQDGKPEDRFKIDPETGAYQEYECDYMPCKCNRFRLTHPSGYLYKGYLLRKADPILDLKFALNGPHERPNRSVIFTGSMDDAGKWGLAFAMYFYNYRHKAENKRDKKLSIGVSTVNDILPELITHEIPVEGGISYKTLDVLLIYDDIPPTTEHKGWQRLSEVFRYRAGYGKTGLITVLFCPWYKTVRACSQIDDLILNGEIQVI